MNPNLINSLPQSLSHLLSTISNIVISEEIGREIHIAVEDFQVERLKHQTAKHRKTGLESKFSESLNKEPVNNSNWSGFYYLKMFGPLTHKQIFSIFQAVKSLIVNNNNLNSFHFRNLSTTYGSVSCLKLSTTLKAVGRQPKRHSSTTRSWLCSISPKIRSTPSTFHFFCQSHSAFSARFCPSFKKDLQRSKDHRLLQRPQLKKN